MMDKIKNFVARYHTYCVIAVGFLTAAAQILFGINVPLWVYDLEGSIGLGSIRITQTQVTGVGGWKTYVVALALAALAGVRAAGIAVPLEVDGMIASLGGVTMTQAAKKS